MLLQKLLLETVWCFPTESPRGPKEPEEHSPQSKSSPLLVHHVLPQGSVNSTRLSVITTLSVIELYLFEIFVFFNTIFYPNRMYLARLEKIIGVVRISFPCRSWRKRTILSLVISLERFVISWFYSDSLHVLKPSLSSLHWCMKTNCSTMKMIWWALNFVLNRFIGSFYQQT